MANSQERSGMHTVCYPSGSSTLRRIAGVTLIVLGAALIVFCVPHWAWWALLGAALITVGAILAGRG